MKQKWLISLVCVVVTLIIAGLFLAAGVYFFNGLFDDTEIKKGFSPELLEELQSRYGITIPEEAKFIKGYNTGGQDNSVLIYFECPVTVQHLSENHNESITQLLKLDPTRYPSSAPAWGSVTGLAAELGGEMDYEMTHSTIAYTSIQYKFTENKLLIRFDGWRPRGTFP